MKCATVLLAPALLLSITSTVVSSDACWPCETFTTGTTGFATNQHLVEAIVRGPSGGVLQMPEGDHPVMAAQRTLGDDYFLTPSLGKGVLHLDVPYGAEVSVAVAGQPYTYAVRGRKRYRNLVLPLGPSRGTVQVFAKLPTSCCDDSSAPRCVREVSMMAGDRQHVTIPASAFSAKTAAPPVALLLAQAATAQAAPATTKHDITLDPKAFGLGSTATDLRLLAWVKYDGAGGTASEFEFSKAQGDTPDNLRLLFAGMDKAHEGQDVELQATLSWKTKDIADPTKPGKDAELKLLGPDKFKFTQQQGNGVALVPFAGKVSVTEAKSVTTQTEVASDSTKTTTKEQTVETPTTTTVRDLRAELEHRLKSALSQKDKPTEINVKFAVKWTGPEHDVKNTVKIFLKEK